MRRFPLVLFVGVLLGSSPCPRETFLQGECPGSEGGYRPDPAAYVDPSGGDTGVELLCDTTTCDGEWALVACRDTWCDAESSGWYCVERAGVEAWAEAAGYSLRCVPSSNGYPPLALEPVCCHSCG